MRGVRIRPQGTAYLEADLERYIRLGRSGYVRPGETALFLARDGRRMGFEGFRQILRKYCTQAGVSRPSYQA